MRPTTIRDYAAKYGRGLDNNFAAACYDDNNLPELVAALTEDADPTDCRTWGIKAEEWKDGVYAALHEKAGGGFAIAVVHQWYNESDTYDWYDDESGVGTVTEYGDQTVYSIGMAIAFRDEISKGSYELSHNESIRPDVYIVTAWDMEKARDLEVSWHNDSAWNGCPCINGSDDEPCAEIECLTCSEHMTNAEIEYIREHAIQI
jgi:hypothetical protein